MDKVANYWAICIVCVILPIIALSVAVINPATGYEVSIYSSTPLVVWLLIAISVGICVVLIAKEESQDRVSKRWLLPLGVLLVNGAIVIAMSSLRDYYTIHSDTLVHIGYVKDMAVGVMSRFDVYRLVHAISAVMVLAGLSAEIATNIIPIIFYLVYVVSFYFLARTIWRSQSKAILATVLASALLLPIGVGVRGVFVAASVFPLMLLLLLRMQREFNVVNVLFFVGFVVIAWMLHSMVLEVVLLSLVVACLMPSPNRVKLCKLVVPLVIAAGLGYGLLYGFGVYGVVFEDLVSGFASRVSILGLLASTHRIGDYGILLLLLRRYGGLLVLGICVIVFLVLVAKRQMHGQAKDNEMLYFSGLFVLFNIMWMVGWCMNMPALHIVLTRMMYWVPTLAIILAVPMLDALSRSRKIRHLGIVTATAVLVFISVYAIFTIYPSPFIGVQNEQVTHQEIKGIKWLYETKGSDIIVAMLNGKTASRYVSAVYGNAWCLSHYHWTTETEPFDYMDYRRIRTAADLCPSGLYLVVSKSDKMLPTWEKNNLYLIETDPSASLIYKDDDECDIWLLKPSGVRE